MKIFALILALVAGIPGAAPTTPPDGVDRIEDLVRQVSGSLDNLPGDLPRLAFYQIRSDRSEVAPTYVRHLQARLEAVFRDPGGRTLVSAPELRTLRVSVTDTSFSVANTEATAEDLWKLGDRLRVDAFVDGTLARDADGNLLLSLRLFRSRNGEVVWNGSWVAGPGKPSGLLADLEFGLQIPLRLFPVANYRVGESNHANTLLVTDIGLEGFVSEDVSKDGRFSMSLSCGYTHHTLVGLPDSSSWNPGVHLIRGGAELEARILRKADPRDGYWIGTYIGASEAIPVFYRDHVTMITAGYRSRITRHLSLSGGIIVLPLTRDLVGVYANEDALLQLDRVSYEAIFLRFTF